MSWPPRLDASASKSSSLRCETIAFNCGVLNSSFLNVCASLVNIRCSSPSTNSWSRFASTPSESRANKSSHIDPHRILITFHPDPLNLPSNSCTILELPRTGPSNLCRLQFMIIITLSRFSLDARVSCDNDSGSSDSPSPIVYQTLEFEVSASPLLERYLLKRAV